MHNKRLILKIISEIIHWAQKNIEYLTNNEEVKTNSENIKSKPPQNAPTQSNKRPPLANITNHVSNSNIPKYSSLLE
jgi:hypothetical protein